MKEACDTTDYLFSWITSSGARCRGSSVLSSCSQAGQITGPGGAALKRTRFTYGIHDDVIKWKHFPRNWPLSGEFTGPGEFPTQRPVTRSFDGFFICVWINGWVYNGEAGDLRRHRGHYDVNVMGHQEGWWMSQYRAYTHNQIKQPTSPQQKHFDWC